MLIVDFIHNNIVNFVGVVLYNYKLPHDVNNMKYIYTEFVLLLWRIYRPEINNTRSG